MKTTFTLLAILFTVASAATAQTAPEGTAGTAVLHYSAQYAMVEDLYGGSVGSSLNSILSGNVDYANGFKRRPFSLTFGGGYAWNITGTALGDGFFENLAVSQGIVGRKWSIQVSDDVSYLNEAPVTGFSGVPGTGEPISGSNPPAAPTQTIFTINTRTVSNTLNGQFQRSLNYATTLSFGGGSELLRYPDGNGLDTTVQTGDAGLTRRINARNSVFAQYSYTDYSYAANNPAEPVSSFITNAAFFGYQRAWNRRISTSFSAGPEWLASSNSALVPSSTSVGANATATDQFRFGSANVNFSRQVSGGGGYLVGGEADTISAGFAREFVRKLSVNLTGGYMRTSGLGDEGAIDGKFGAAMATLRLSRYLTSFASYTAADQSATSSSTLPGNALTGLWQVVSFGVGYSPREKRVNSQ